MFFYDEWREKEGRSPTDEELQRAACALIYYSESSSEATTGSTASWLRDLLFSSDRLAEEAKWIKLGTVTHRQQLKINGKSNIFENDPMEAELHEYVKARRLLGLTALDSELQSQACRIIQTPGEKPDDSSDEITHFLIRLINGSTEWLASFRQRAHLPRSEDIADESRRSKDPATIDSTIHNPSRLEFELGEFVREQLSLGIQPTDADLQRQARIIIYEYDDGWNQTSADDPLWLSAFKEKHIFSALNVAPLSDQAHFPLSPKAGSSGVHGQVLQPSGRRRSSEEILPPSSAGSGGGTGNATRSRTTGRYYLADTNCYLRLARELKKWVAATMSPNNPNCHVPSDEELQHQARWIVYEDDDPWNQTAADNAEWLRRFKRDAGILSDPSVPGLPRAAPWTVTDQDGSGFAPPYVNPNPIKRPPFPTASAIKPAATAEMTTTSQPPFHQADSTTSEDLFPASDLLYLDGGTAMPFQEQQQQQQQPQQQQEKDKGGEGLAGATGAGLAGAGGVAIGAVAVGSSTGGDAGLELSGAVGGGELGDVLQNMNFDFADLGDFMVGGDGGMMMDL
ncbi:hypothetical protein VTK26DRAFT_3473 [Humicola hyalothermophila]